MSLNIQTYAKKKIALFCGAKEGTGEFKKSALSFAKWLVVEKHSLIYGGGGTGIMGLVSNHVLDNGGHVTGVIPHFLYKWEVGNDRCNELIKVDTMHERKAKMCEMADAFVVLPGGFGTLDEICEIITWHQLKLINKPMAFLNDTGFFDLFFKFLHHASQKGFISTHDLDRIQILNSIEEFKW